MTADIFTQARSAKLFKPEPIAQETLDTLIEWVKWSPSESNSWPFRVVFVQSESAKARLLPLVAEGNQHKVESAPVIAILSYDEKFTDHLPTLAPHLPTPSYFDTLPAEAREFAMLRSANLQAGFFMCAARSLGLDCGPLAGFDREGVNQEFFADSSWRASFLCMLGHADPETYYPRGARLDTQDWVRFE